MTPVANSGNNIRLLLPWSEPKRINVSMCEMSKNNNQNFYYCRFLPPATAVNDTSGAPWAANVSKNFRKKLKWPYWDTQEAWGKLIHEKSWSRKSHGTVPLMCVSGTDLPSREAGSVSALGQTLSALYTSAFFAQIRKKTEIKVYSYVRLYGEVRT